MLFGKLLNQRRLNAQRFAYVAQSAAWPVAGNGGGYGRAVMTVFFIDVLNDFFTPLVLKVHINIRWLAALAADETLK